MSSFGQNGLDYWSTMCLEYPGYSVHRNGNSEQNTVLVVVVFQSFTVGIMLRIKLMFGIKTWRLTVEYIFTKHKIMHCRRAKARMKLI